MIVDPYHTDDELLEDYRDWAEMLVTERGADDVTSREALFEYAEWSCGPSWREYVELSDDYDSGDPYVTGLYETYKQDRVATERTFELLGHKPPTATEWRELRNTFC